MRHAAALGPSTGPGGLGWLHWPQNGGAAWRNERPVSAPAKLVGFLLLLAAVFMGARAAGAYLGPVTTSQSQSEQRRASQSGGGRVDEHGRPAVSETGELSGEQVELVVGGMSCGSCAARIERRLNRLDGVVAAVNYATERAYIASTAAGTRTS